MNARHAPPAIPGDILDEAAQWLVVMNDDPVSDSDRRDWLAWRARSPAHESAWLRSEKLLARLGQMPAALAMPALDRPRTSRRAALAKLAALCLVVPGGVAAWRLAQSEGWTADYRSAAGERRDVTLADGSRMTLNTASAVDLRFDADERLVLLRAGEILIQTAPDPQGAHRPFRVRTAEGTLEALGTRFSVRQQDGRTMLAVLEGAVRATPRLGADAARVIPAGQQAVLEAGAALPPAALDAAATAWTRGMLLADNLPLGDFVTELARYRRGLLRCEPAIASLRVSGTFPVGNPRQALAMLEATYPVDIASRLGGYWITVLPRSR